MTQVIWPNISKMQKFRMRKPPIKSGNRILVIFKITFRHGLERPQHFTKPSNVERQKPQIGKIFFQIS